MAVLSIRKDHPDVKMIVFSMVGVDIWWSCDVMWSDFQWSESLELVAHGLKQNGVQFLHGKDQKSLQVLAPPTRTCLKWNLHRNHFMSSKRMKPLKCYCCRLILALRVSILLRRLMWSCVSRHLTWLMNIKLLAVFTVWVKQGKHHNLLCSGLYWLGKHPIGTLLSSCSFLLYSFE